MDAKTCMEKLKLVGVLSFAMVDSKGNPQIRCISAIHFDKESFYFFTARGKNFCKELLENGKVQILAYTRFKEMIRLSAKAECVPESDQKEKINTIFAEQPYLSNVYPGDTQKIGIVFEIKNAEIEYFNLGVKPIFRESYTLGKGTLSEKGYVITDSCIGCGSRSFYLRRFFLCRKEISGVFSDFEEKYGFYDMYSGGFYPYKTPEESCIRNWNVNMA